MRRKQMWLLASVLAGIAVVACTSAVYAAGSSNGDGLAAGLGDQGVAATCTGNTKQSKQQFANTGDQNSTSSTTFVDIPGAVVPINVSSKGGPKCVSVIFTAMAFASGGELELVRALLDGAAGNPADTQFEGDSGIWATSQAMTFVFPNVPAGAHTVRMQFRSNGGGSVFIHRGTVLVLFA
jgi:hypothetical protein